MFLDDLIGRTLGVDAAVSPRRASRFEMAAEPFETMDVEQEAAPPPAPTRPTRSDIEPTPPQAKDAVEPVREREVVMRLERVPPVEPARPATAALPDELTGPERRQASAAIPPIDWSQLPEPPVQQRELIVDHPFEKPIQPHATPQVSPGETVIREVREVHHDNRTIERMLESLTRETRVERSVVVERASPAASDNAQQTEHPRRRAPDRLELVTRQRPPATAGPSPFGEADKPQPEPVVHVTIGRVEVRAAAATPSRPEQRTRKAKPALDDYLRRRDGR